MPPKKTAKRKTAATAAPHGRLRRVQRAMIAPPAAMVAPLAAGPTRSTSAMTTLRRRPTRMYTGMPGRSTMKTSARSKKAQMRARRR